MIRRVTRVTYSALGLALAAVTFASCGTSRTATLSEGPGSTSTTEAPTTTTTTSGDIAAFTTTTTTPPGAEEPPLTAEQVADAKRQWPAIREQIRTYFNWQTGPVGKAYLAVAADAYPEARASLDVAKGEPFTVWVVRGVFAEYSSMDGPPGQPMTRGWWFVVRANGGIGIGFDYGDPATAAAPPSAISQLPILREELDLR
jgi:hypothetical protein